MESKNRLYFYNDLKVYKANYFFKVCALCELFNKLIQFYKVRI